jgi:hypothetical protein
VFASGSAPDIEDHAHGQHFVQREMSNTPDLSDASLYPTTVPGCDANRARRVPRMLLESKLKRYARCGAPGPPAFNATMRPVDSVREAHFSLWSSVPSGGRHALRLAGDRGMQRRWKPTAAECMKIDTANSDQNQDQMIFLGGTKFGIFAAKR